MARIDLKPVDNNPPIDLHAKRAADPNMPMSPAILDLNEQANPVEPSSNQFFFEFMPAALEAPEVLPSVVTAIFDRIRMVRVTTRQVLIALAILVAIFLIGLTTTHRRVVQQSAPPSASTTTTSQSSAPSTQTTATGVPSVQQQTTNASTSRAPSSAATSTNTLTTSPTAPPSSQPPSTTTTTPSSTSSDPGLCVNTLVISTCASATPSLSLPLH